MGGRADAKWIVSLVDLTNGDVFRDGHLVACKVLKDDANLLPQIFQVVLAEIYTVQKNLSSSRVVQTRKKLHDSCLPMPILSHQRNSRRRFQLKTEVVEHESWIRWV